jgi:16S rRNA (guanine527-N7)-methyltransferase
MNQGFTTIIDDRLGQLAASLRGQGFGLAAELEPGVAQKLAEYLELLQRWTGKVDLVAPASTEQQLERHIVDCVAAYWVLSSGLEKDSLGSCLDVGSGAGLPGFVFALLDTQGTYYLCEPREKRQVFLREAIRKLGLNNAEVIGLRTKELSSDDFPASLDLVTSRALGDDKTVLETGAKLLSAVGLVAQLVGPSWTRKEGISEPFFELSYDLGAEAGRRKVVVWENCFV